MWYRYCMNHIHTYVRLNLILRRRVFLLMMLLYYIVVLSYYYYVLYGWNDHVREYTVLQLHTVRRNLMLVNTTLSPFFFRNCKVTFSRRNHVIGIHPTARAGLLFSCIVDSEVGQSRRLNCLRDPDAKSGCQRRVGHLV